MMAAMRRRLLPIALCACAAATVAGEVRCLDVH
jgi:hypothetical protein